MGEQAQIEQQGEAGQIPSADVLPAVADNSSVLAVIARAARDPSVDVNKMERLVAMQERLIARQAEMDFNAAMGLVQGKLPNVIKDADNNQTNSRYAKLETVSKAVNPVINAHGFTLSYGTSKSDLESHYRVTLDISHTGGHTKHYFADIPVDIAGIKGNTNKTLTHAFGSTISYGRRYLKILAFDIVVSGEDDDGNSPYRRQRQDNRRPRQDDRSHSQSRPPVIGRDKAEMVVERLKRAGISVDNFCQHYKIASVPDLLMSDLDVALDRIRRKIQSRPRSQGDRR